MLASRATAATPSAEPYSASGRAPRVRRDRTMGFGARRKPDQCGFASFAALAASDADCVQPETEGGGNPLAGRAHSGPWGDHHACRHAFCARLRPHDFSAFPAAPLRSTAPAARGPSTARSAAASEHKSESSPGSHHPLEGLGRSWERLAFPEWFCRDGPAHVAAAPTARQRSQVPQRDGCSSPKYRRRNTLRHSSDWA
jgi:hypothetical protein